MKKVLWLLSIVFMGLNAHAQEIDPVKVAQTQLDFYNQQDLNGFVSVFAEDAEVYFNLGDSAATLIGKPAIKARYGEMFQTYPNNKSTLIGRMVQGNFVFDHEWIDTGSSEFKIVAIYEVESGLIQRCWFAR